MLHHPRLLCACFIVTTRLNDLLGDHPYALDESLQVLHHVFLGCLLISCCSCGSWGCFSHSFLLLRLVLVRLSFLGILLGLIYLICRPVLFLGSLLHFFLSRLLNLVLGLGRSDLLLVLMLDLLLRFQSFELIEHLSADELEVALVVDLIARVTLQDREAVIGQQVTDDFLLLLREHGGFHSIYWSLEAQVDLELALAENLDELLQSTCDVVGVGKLVELALNLLCFEETQSLVAAHLCVIRIAVLMRTNKQVNIVALGPPD